MRLNGVVLGVIGFAIWLVVWTLAAAFRRRP